MLTLATATNDGFHGAFGIGIATAAATAAGGASVPTPITEDASDNWLFHRYFSVTAGFPFATGADPAGNLHAFVDFEIDSKAMRKSPLETSLYAALEVTEVGTAAMLVFHNSRVLVKLP